MGKIIEKKKRKKKKGRPSLLDLQKRTLKQQKHLLNKFQKNKFNLKTPNLQNPNPNPNSSTRRSTRRNPNPNSDDDGDDGDDGDGDVSRSGKNRREKKLNAVLNLPNQQRELNTRKRKIEAVLPGSGVKDSIKGEKHSDDATKQSSTQQGGGSNLDDDGPSTSLPDKSLLVFILDRLQKKDTYGVFSDPVDPEELPDYHEVIEDPMDFSTVRKKLDEGAYATLEEFEKDVFLICSNAMQYNAPDTVYFRQARSIEELAKKNFDNLRADSDDNNDPVKEREPEPKVVRRGRPPTKNLKRPPGRPPLERATSNFSEATVAHNNGGNANRSNNEMRKSSHSEKNGSSDSLARSLYGTRYGEAYLGWSAERYDRVDDITGSASKGYSTKFGKKHIVHDESRRNTYMHSCALASGEESSVLSTFKRERKQLIAVGLHTEYGYARSLARFGAKIGPVAWTVASKKIERCLPSGVKFGPGWVGENIVPPEKPIHQDSHTSTEGPSDTNFDGSSHKPQQAQLPDMQKSCSEFKVKEESGEARLPEASASSPSSTLVNISNNGSGSLKMGQTTIMQSCINGLNGSYGHNFAAQMGKIIGSGRPTMFNLQTDSSVMTVSRSETHSPRPSATTENNGSGEAKLGNNSTVKSIYLPNTELSQNGGPTPPDLNVGFKSPGSPVSGKPDLALQL